MLPLLLGAWSVLVLVALGFIGWRQKQLAQRVDALRDGVDRLRVDVAQIRREVGLEPDGDAGPQPRIVRRKRHLGLVGAIAAGLGVVSHEVGSTKSSNVSCCGRVSSGSGGWSKETR
jgi:hypothetical protein